MPRIPVYEQQVQQLPTPDARVGLRPTEADFGGDVGAGLEKLAAGVDKYEEGQDRARVMDATSDMNRWVDLALHDPDRGVLTTTKGKDAVGVADTWAKAWKDAADSVRGG